MTEEIDKDTLEALRKGAEWYKRHREEVNDLIDGHILGGNTDANRIKPGSVLLHSPWMWSSRNWIWFFKEANKWLP